ncbi:MAG: hypothetical protein WB439_08610 [Acidobacteriaceae bacterium]
MPLTTKHRSNEKETTVDRAARRTADATVWLTRVTILLAAIAVFNLYEVIEDGTDTRKLADSAVTANRAWIAPEQMILDSPVESGLPLKYQIRIVNPGKEPALDGVWNVKSFGAPYIREGRGPDPTRFGHNSTCEGLHPNKNGGMTVYPSGATNFWIPLSVEDTPDNRILIAAVQNRSQSLVLEGCFAYLTDGAAHTSAFRFFLRDIPGPSFATNKEGTQVEAWNFNATFDGNDAN